MVFTSVRNAVTKDRLLINLEQLCYIVFNEDEDTYELWFSHERGLGFNSISINEKDAQKVFALIKAYGEKLEGAETELLP